MKTFESILKHLQGHATLRTSMSATGSAQPNDFGPNTMLSTSTKVSSWDRGSSFLRIPRKSQLNTSLLMSNCNATFRLGIVRILKTNCNTKKTKLEEAASKLGYKKGTSNISRELQEAPAKLLRHDLSNLSRSYELP